MKMLEKGEIPASQSRLRPSKGRPPPRRGEVLVAASLFTLLALVVYGLYVANGGFYADDWAHVSTFQFADAPRYWSSFEHFQEVLGGRPLFALILPLPQAAFGNDPAAYLGLAALLAAIASTCFYGLLRTLGMARVNAGSVAALALLFPWSDSIRLWPTGSLIGISVCFFLLGLNVALRGLARRGRQGLAMHAGADILFALSILTYESAAAAALLAGALYLGRAPLAAAVRRWLADVLVVFATLAYSLATTSGARPVSGPLDRIGEIPSFLRDASVIAASALEPFGSLGRTIQALLLLAAAAIVGASLLRLRREPDRQLREWLRWLAIGLVGIACAYVMFLGSNLKPLDPGIDNRINVFAGFGFCLFAYALVACGCRLAFRSDRSANLATVALVLVLAVGYLIRTADDQGDWREAAERQRTVLDALGTRNWPSGSTVLAFGVPAQAAPGVPVFGKSWDLGGALRVELDDPHFAAFPVHAGVNMRCRADGLQVSGPGDYGSTRVKYGQLYFFDGPTARRARIANHDACARALDRFEPGPLEA
jgi:hypothetical protein